MDGGGEKALDAADRSPAAAGRTGWTAIVLAGSRPGEDPLARRFGLPLKALVPALGEPMVGRVVRTLLECSSVARVLILLQEPQRLATDELEWLSSDARVALAEGANSIAASLARVAGTPAAPWPALITTADHALLTPEMVEYFLERSSDADASLGVVERNVVLARYPGIRRSWVRFGRRAYKGGNLFTLAGEAALPALRLFADAESDRKNGRKLLWYFGPLLALGAATRTISLDRAAAHVGRRLGMRLSVVLLPFPEAAIDVDRPEHLALAERILGAKPPEDEEPAEAISIFGQSQASNRGSSAIALLRGAIAQWEGWRFRFSRAAGLPLLRAGAERLSRKTL